MSLDENKENTEWRNRAFETKVENIYDIEIQNSITFIHGNNEKKIWMQFTTWYNKYSQPH